MQGIDAVKNRPLYYKLIFSSSHTPVLQCSSSTFAWLSSLPIRIQVLLCIVITRRMPVQRAALCIQNFPSQYRTHFRGLSGHNAGRFNATVFISMLSGGELAFPLTANTSLLASIVRAQTIPSARERCTCSGVWRSVTIPS